MSALLLLAACVDPDEPPACPSGEIGAEVVDFGEAGLGEPVVAWVTLANACSDGDALAVDARIEGAGFAIGAAATSIGPGATDGVGLVFTPEGYGPAEGALTLTTNDPLRPRLTVTLRGVGAADQDGDGHDALAAGGDDCDDADAAVYTGADERPDLGDDDCDGLVDEDFVGVGDVWITEVMARPEAADDALGEWIEVYNATDAAIDLAGWRLTTRSCSVGLGTFVVPARGHAVLGASMDAGQNGGVVVDAAWPACLLDDTEDTVTLERDGVGMSAVAYAPTWATVPGRALALDPSGDATSSTSTWWCSSAWRLPSGDYGTPGTANGGCPAIDHDGDRFAEDDCDDTNAAVNPDARESWNGVDDDCDEVVDDLTTEATTAGWVQGVTPNGRLGESGLVTGDLDGDGLPELILGSSSGGAGAGLVHVLDGDGWRAWAGDDAATAAAVNVTSPEATDFGFLPAELGDLTGDGGVDLLVAGSDQGNGAWAVWAGPLTSAPTLATAFSRGVGFEPARAPGVATADVDGDGVREVVYASPDGVGLVWVLRADAGDVGPAAADAILTGAGDGLGAGLAAADLDGDGYPELLVGAPTNDDHSADSGALYVVPTVGLAGTVAAAEAARFEVRGEHSAGLLGAARTITTGDVDGDGAVDLAVGAYATSEVYVYLAAGARSGVIEAATRDLLLASDVVEGHGQPVCMGDVDGDGRDDLLTGGGLGGVGTALYLYTGLEGDLLRPEDDSVASFATAASHRVEHCAVTDVDGDGARELVLTSPTWSGGYGATWVFGP